MPELYVMRLNEAEKLSEELCRTHFPKRFERSNRYLRQADRLRCRAAGALLYHLGIEESQITQNEYGKPIVEGKCFNLSHSGQLIICARDFSDIGADTEEPAPLNAGVAERALNADELKFMDSSAERFLLLWTMKEAVMKAVGMGFSLNPKDINLLPALENRAIRVNGQTVFVHSMQLEGYPVSICCTHDFEMPCPIFVSAESK